MTRRRRLTIKQQGVAADAMRFVQPSIASFVKKNADLRSSIRRVDLESVAYQAVCMAAFTYDSSKSLPTTYFGSAIRHALYREVLKQQQLDGRYVPVEKILEPQPNRSRTRQEMRALKALRMMSAFDRDLLEDRLIEQVTLEQLSLEHACDPRTIAKRVQRAIDRLKSAEANLP
jgi:RNA polymerase sigma factor (sigma-70 family)